MLGYGNYTYIPIENWGNSSDEIILGDAKSVNVFLSSSRSLAILKTLILFLSIVCSTSSTLICCDISLLISTR